MQRPHRIEEMGGAIRLHAGYVLDGVRAALATDESAAFNADEALAFLTEFEVAWRWAEGSVSDPAYTVAANFVSRGGPLPTRPSCELEDAFASAHGWTARHEDALGAISYRLDTDDGFVSLLVRALAVVDPRLTPAALRREVVSWETHDSGAEERFAYEVAPALLGRHAPQVLEAQRPFDTIARDTPPQFDYTDLFWGQRVDFAVQFPSRTDGVRSAAGLVVEVDGWQHDEPVQKKVDGQRNEKAKSAGWDTLRIPTGELPDLPVAKRKVLEAHFAHPFAQALAENARAPLWTTAEGRAALDLALAPFGIARVQRVLLHLVLTGVLDPDAETWRVAVVERDVPCAALAADDLERMLGHLLALEGRGRRLPRIELAVYNTPEFVGSPLADPTRTRLFTGPGALEPADVLLDVSVLQRAGLTDAVPLAGAAVYSVHAPTAQPRFHSAEAIRYAVPDEEQPEALAYFLRSALRKREFREGQMPVLRRALTGLDVVALLPTGAGKSLTYQLAALLQPGLTVVVDPIKSLMRDQCASLARNGIGAAVAINSSFDAKAKALAVRRMTEGAFLFVFVSPERFQSDDFREALALMDDVRFAFGVVDEAHCVSEWGHDFRTAYLRLAPNLRAHCRPTGTHLPLLALTGTASYDVLDDVKRELEVDEEAVVRLTKMERAELRFHVVRVDAPGLGEMHDPWKARDFVAEQKHQALLDAVASLPELLGREDMVALFAPEAGIPGAGIVFAPHAGAPTSKGYRSPYGTEVIAALLRQKAGLEAPVAFFHGKMGDRDKDGAQDAFTRDETAVLAATKAFGMGIDKPNVRFTVHLNMPASIESFYQEAGRAGRDREPAVCAVLYCPATFRASPDAPPSTVDRDVVLFFHRNSFKGAEADQQALDALLVGRAAQDGEPAIPSIERVLNELPGGRKTPVVIPFGQNAGLEREDVFKAVYRLYLVGAVADYTVQYGGDESGTITADVQRQPDEAYVEALQRYVGRYVSPAEGDRVPAEIGARDEPTALRRCLGRLLTFVYERIAAQRVQAIEAMERALADAVDEGVQGGDAGRVFAERVNSYFDSRFAPELAARLRDPALDVADDFMGQVRGVIDGAAHLRGACDRLLSDHPDHPALLLLRAYASLVLPSARNDDAQNDAEQALAVVRRQHGAEAELDALHRLYAHVAEADPALCVHLDPLLVRHHADRTHATNDHLVRLLDPTLA